MNIKINLVILSFYLVFINVHKIHIRIHTYPVYISSIHIQYTYPVYISSIHKYSFNIQRINTGNISY